MAKLNNLNPNKIRDSIFTEFGTTNKLGHKLYKKLQEAMEPVVFEACESYLPQEVGMVASAVVGLAASKYAATLLHHSKSKRNFFDETKL